MTAQPENDSYEFTFVGDLKVGDEVRTLGVIKQVEIGSMTNTVHFEAVRTTARTWHQFHSVEVKKKESK